MTFAFYEAGPNTGATACLAVTNDRMVDGLTNSATIGMSAHFLTTPTVWVYTAWEPGTGMVVLLSGAYATPLAVDNGVTEYSMELWLKGTTAVFRTADGLLHKVTDSRIGIYAGPYAFAESYSPNSDDDITIVSGFYAAPTGALGIPPAI